MFARELEEANSDIRQGSIIQTNMGQVGSHDQFRRLEGLLSPVIRMLLNDQAGVAVNRRSLQA